MFRRSHSRFIIASASSSSIEKNNQESILSILDSSIPRNPARPPQENVGAQEKKQQQQETPSSATPKIYEDFNLLNPKVRPTSLPYICPPKWINLVSETVEANFKYQLLPTTPSSSSSSNSTKTKKAPRPELFVQSFVHPSFLRDYERKKFQKLQREEEGEKNASNEQEEEEQDTSMASLAEVGSNVLRYSSTIMSNLIPDPDETTNASSTSSARSRNQQKHSIGSSDDLLLKEKLDSSKLVDFTVFPMGGEFLSSVVRSQEKELSTTEKLSIHHFSNFASKTFASPRASMANQRVLSEAITSDHNLSLVSFNIWKVSDLVLTDAGIFGLRDALRSSSKDKLKVPPLPMPAAAMNVKAVVGAVYLNFGLEEAVKFCQVHVIPHAVNMMAK